MLLFLIEKGILHIITEYIHHLQWYLKEEFAIDADIIVYQGTCTVPDKYTNVVFVQRINSHIMNGLCTNPSNIPKHSRPNIEQLIPRRNSNTFKTNRTTVNTPDYKRGTSVALVSPQKTTRIAQKTFSTHKINPFRKTMVQYVAPFPLHPPIAPKIQQEKAPAIRATPIEHSVTPTKQIEIHQTPAIRATPIEHSGMRGKRIFLLNTEQMTVPMFLHNTKTDIHEYNPDIIDYSQENIVILRTHFPASRFIYFPYPFKVQNFIAKPHTVVSLLSSQHRRTICKNLGTPIIDFAGRWGKARDNVIKSSKILLNIHYQSDIYKIFESIRCYNALEQRTLVISEPVYDKNLLLLKDYIIFASKGEMKEKVQEVIENYQLYYEQVFSEPRIKEMEQRLKDVYKNSIEIYLT